jgi:outer membrane protein assembly factor BamB
LYGINRKTGAVVWQTRMASAGILLGPWSDSNRAFAVTMGQGKWSLITVDAVTGKRAWAVPVAKDNSELLFSPLGCAGIVSVGRLVVASLSDERLTLKQSGLTAVAAGTIRWRRPLLNATIAVAGGERLFAASYDSVLHEIDPTTGRTQWSISTAGPVDTLHAGATMLIATAGLSTTAYPLLNR